MKILHYDPDQEIIKAYSIDRIKLILLPILAIGALLILGLGFAGFYMQYQENSTIRSLKRQNQYLLGVLNRLQNQSTTIQSQISKLKTQSVKLSEYAQLPVRDITEYAVGSGGNDYTTGLDEVIVDQSARAQIIETAQNLDIFKQQVRWLYADLNAIEGKFALDKDLRRRLPSIRPVQDGILTSGFGERRDPFTQAKRHHNGLDFFAKTGTPVIATADGIVELIRKEFTPNEALGKLIVINHGNGIKTRYGHLNSIQVKQGQQVKRHEIIGQVGNTGRSTGPHLHYEVIKGKRFKNPEYFVLD